MVKILPIKNLIYQFLLIIKIILNINNYLVYKIISNLINILIIYFLFLKLIFI